MKNSMTWDGTRESIDAICKWVNTNDNNDPIITYVFTSEKEIKDVLIWSDEQRDFVGVEPGDTVHQDPDGGPDGSFYVRGSGE